MSSYLGATSAQSVDMLELLPLAEPELRATSVTEALSSGRRALKVKMNGGTGLMLEQATDFIEMRA